MIRHLNPKDFNGVQEITLEQYNAIQAIHILKHKWYLSEEKGYEVSFNDACYDWVKSELAKEFRKYFKLKQKTK